MKAVILRPFHRERAKCDGTHSVAAIMFCGSTLCHHQPHLHLLLAMYKIGRSGTRSKFWSLTLISRLWWSSADMILSMCICSNASKMRNVTSLIKFWERWGSFWGNPSGWNRKTPYGGVESQFIYLLFAESRFVYLVFVESRLIYLIFAESRFIYLLFFP